MSITTNQEQQIKITQRLGTFFHVTAHFSVDFFLSFFAPTLPVLIQKLDLLKVEAGFLSLAVELCALTMPLIGRIADRKDIRKYMFLAPVITGLCMSSLSIIPNYYLLLLVLILGGVAIYFYHAIGPADVGNINNKTLGRAMAIWNIAGQVAFMIGPMLIAWILSLEGPSKAPYLAILGLATSIFLLAIWKRYNNTSQQVMQEKTFDDEAPIKRDYALIAKQFLPILGIIITGALARASAYAYFPIFVVEEGAELWVSGLTVSIYFGAGVIGQYIAGYIYDRIGARWVIAIAIAGFALSLAGATISPLVLQLILVGATGFFAFMLIPTFMAMLQENFPKDRSLTNGLFLGLMYSITALASVGAGYFLDRLATQRVFLISAAISLVGLLFAPFLHERRHQEI